MPTKRILSAASTVLLLATLSCDSGGPGLLVQPAFQGRIQGAVATDESMLSGVTVQLTGGQTRTVQTSTNGAFSFPGLPKGDYVVEITGYPEDVEFPATSKPASIHEYGAAARVDFNGAIKRDGAISGTVTMEGAGMGGVDISVTGPEIRSTTTDSQGAFTLDQLKRGVYTLTLTGFDPALHSFPTTQQTVDAKNGNVVEAHFPGTLVPRAPEGPTGPTAVATGPSTVALNWVDESDEETRFEIERREGADGSWNQVAALDPNSTTFGDVGLTPNTTYHYRVRACNDVGCSGFSDEADATTHEAPPGAPSGLIASPTGSTTVSLTWTDGSDNETRFEIERKTGPAGDWILVRISDPDAVAFGDTGLTPNTAYAYRVRACNGVSCSAYSNEASTVTNEVAPEAPTGLGAVATGSATVELTWTDASDNEARFEVERKEGAEGIWSQIGTPNPDATAYGDTGLTPNTTYVYRVRACNEVGCSTFSNDADATTDEVAPGAPSGLIASATGYATVDLSWTDESDNETGFRVERKEGGAGVYSAAGNVAANTASFADTGLSPNTTYFYRVIAFNPSGDSTPSNEDSATTWSGSGLNLSISNLYLTQSTQTLGGTVPQVTGKDGYLRVFAVASEANSLQPSVRVRFYLGGSLAHTEVISSPGLSAPTGVDESNLGSSWNVDVPAALIQPGLSILADVDPTNQVAEANEGDNSFPVGGSPLAINVRSTTTFEVTFVPVRQSVNSLLGNVTAGNAAQYMDVTMRMLPIAQANLGLHAEYVTNALVLESDNGNGAWGTILSEVNSLRVTEGTSRYYYGVVKTTYGSGVAGMGYLGWPTAIGWDHLPSGSSVAAHEWGHNWNRRHAAGCGAGSPDPSYPYADGKIGVWGLDVNTESPKSPSTYYDFMSYCGPDWISDYSYEAILDYRQTYGGYASPGQPEPSLLVWGRMEGDRIVLEPAFEVTTTPVLPAGSGEYRLEAIDQSGGAFLSMAFQPIPVPDAGEGAGHFAFAIPLRSIDRNRIAGLRVSGGGRSQAYMGSRIGPEAVAAQEPELTPLGGSVVEMTWDAASFPMALVRDPTTGEVLSFARGGRVILSIRSDEVEVIFSDGLKSSERVRLPVR